MNYIALFFTHSGAIKYTRFLKNKGIYTEKMPVPRKISSNCGIGVKFIVEQDLSDIISEDIEKIYRIDELEYKLIYQCE